uniref:G-protein coupled receptors family 3 profile domain-containing protein n=1 Tax=Romanomermis culicivorax TaxID=13658 RepID=A0A915KLL5_ROMCU
MDFVSSIGLLAFLICIFGQIHSLPSTVVWTPSFHYYSKLRNLLTFYGDKSRRCESGKVFRFNLLENDLILNLTKNTKLGRFLAESNSFFDCHSDDISSSKTRLISSMEEDTHRLVEIAIITRSIDKFSVQGFKRNVLGRIHTFENYSLKRSDWEAHGENLHICSSNLHDCILSIVDYGNNVDDDARMTELLYRTNCGDQNDKSISWEVIFVQRMRRRNLRKKSPVVDSVYMILPLSSLELNQCDNDISKNIKMNVCPEATKCIFVPGGGFSINSYLCCCHNRLLSSHSFSDKDIDRWKFCLNESTITDLYFKNPEKSTDFVHYCREIVDSSIFRKILFSINILCGLFAFVLIFVAISHRRTQDWSARGWALMELFFLGAILLYLIVRKAHHVFVKEKDLLKYLLFVAVFTLIGLLAFTLTISDASSSSIFSTTTILAGGQSSTAATSSSAMVNKRWLVEESTPTTKEFVERRTFPLVSIGITTLENDGGVGGIGVAGRRYFVCTIFKWNFAWQGLELILLLYGCYLTYKARNTSWVERKQFGFSVLSEMLVTTVINSVRYNLWLTTSPNTLLLLSFVQVHCTVTLSIAVILASKLYYANTDHSNRAQSLMSSGTSRAHPSLAKLRDNLVNGAIDFAEVPITEMNPEDIKAELKRVYTQLRMYKLTNLYADNPHISKRKGGKKSSSKQQQQQQQQPNQQGRRVSSTGATTNANSSATKKRKDHFKNKFEMEEKSSLARANDDDSASVGSIHDLTVQSSMHNVYLSRTSLAAAKKLQLDSDLSVRI